MLLATAAECTPPMPRQPLPEYAETIEVPWYRIVVGSQFSARCAALRVESALLGRAAHAAQSAPFDEPDRARLPQHHSDARGLDPGRGHQSSVAFGISRRGVFRARIPPSRCRQLAARHPRRRHRPRPFRYPGRARGALGARTKFARWSASKTRSPTPRIGPRAQARLLRISCSGGHHVVTLHRKQRTLNKELKDAERALGEDPTEANLSWLRDVQQRLAALEGSEALIEGFGLSSGRRQGAYRKCNFRGNRGLFSREVTGLSRT